MHVAFISSPENGVIFGGHTIQINKTRQYIEALGHRVSVISHIASPAAEPFDVLHFWLPHRPQVEAASDDATPKVLSPIYHSRSVRYRFAKEYHGAQRFYAGLLRSTLSKQVKTRLGLSRQFSPEEDLAFALDQCDLFIPNSESEAAAVYAATHSGTPHFVAPNAADLAFRDVSPEAFVAAYGLRDFVICVGRFEPYKNQLGLIRALEGSGKTLVLVGAPHPHHPDYFAQCKAHFGESVVHIPHIPYDELPSAYAAARVSVLPSYFETTGLVSLEAGLAGINVVTTDRGYTREYFKDFAWYCDPSRTESIQRAVLDAWNTPPSTDLQERIAQYYTWEVTATQTVEAYKKAIVLHE